MGISVGKYSYSRLIGGGAYGRVYEARRLSDGLECALKLPRENSSQEAQERFRREIALQAGLKHPHIVPILSAETSANPPYFIMPRAVESLRQRLDRGNLGQEQIFIVEQIALGLIHAHKHNIIHRDLSPENILLFENPQGLYAAISDFGLGRFIGSNKTTLTITNRKMGKAAYASPEQHQDSKRVDARSDIYSLGKILAEVLTGTSPLNLEPMDVPPPFRLIVKTACARTPAERYQTVLEMLEAIRYATTYRSALEKPARTIEREARKLPARVDSPTETRKLANLLINHSEDMEVLQTVLPSLPIHVLQALLRHDVETMEHVVKTYDQSVSGSLKFDYCDTVADFYHALFINTTSLTIQHIIISRLPTLGARHRRWHVGNVLERVFKHIDNIELILALRHVLSKEPQTARWCAPYLQKCSLPPALKTLLREKESAPASRQH